MSVLKVKDVNGNWHNIVSLKGDKGEDAITDQTYNPTSENAQSGKAVAEALKEKANRYIINNWEDVKNIVINGDAPTEFPIGTQLVAQHSTYGRIVFDVVAYDYLKNPENENARTMSLLAHDIPLNTPFDVREAFYYADEELPAGTYCFSLKDNFGLWKSGTTYGFTLDEPLLAGSQLCISGNQDVSLTSLKVVAYANFADTTGRTYDITETSEGTYLGDMGLQLNHPHRVCHGSNNYKESAVRQFLNSSNDAGLVWAPQTKFDRPPYWHTNATLEGFQKGLETSFLNAVCQVVVPCSANNTYEAPDSEVSVGQKYELVDKFCLASQKEVFNDTSNIVNDNSTVLPYYSTEGIFSFDADTTKYKDNINSVWWLRSSRQGHGTSACICDKNGKASGNYAESLFGVVVLCAIGG